MKQLNPREIQHAVDQLEEQPESSAIESEITVRWGVADPENRPEGVTYVPETNTLTYDLWSAQADTLEALQQEETDIVGFLAGYGSGKSIFGARWLIKQALAYDNSRFLAMGKSFSEARSTTFRILFEQLPGERTGVVTKGYNGPEQSPVVRDYHKSEHKLTLTNDTTIKLGSADKWNRYAGDEYGGMWLDEPSHYGDLHNLLEMMGSRLRGVDGPKSQLWTLTGNGLNSAFDILERKEDSTGDELGLEIEVVKASTLDNPYLDETDKERFKRQYGNTAREEQALHGGFAQGGGALLKRDQLHFMDREKAPDCEYRWHIGVDLSYLVGKEAAEKDGDYTAVAVVAVPSNGGCAYLTDVKRKRGLSLRESVSWLAQIAGQFQRPTVKIEDVGGQAYYIQEAERVVNGHVEPVNPGNQSKESRLADMGVIFERGEENGCIILNHEVDENLGYDSLWKEFVREWCQLGTADSSPDILDSVWYALHGIELNRGNNSGFVAGSAYSNTSPYSGGGSW